MSADNEGVAVITGGASGIGFAAAARMNAAGRKVVLADINADGLAGAMAGLPDPSRAATVVVDVRDEDSVIQMVKVAEEFGGLRVAVNAAGIGSFGPLVDLSLADWRGVLDVTLTGVFLSMKHEASALIASGSEGAIINVASLNSFQPAEGMVSYCTAKAGVEMLTRVGAMELGPKGVRVVGVAPGLVDTPMTRPLIDHEPIRQAFVSNSPLGRVGQPKDVADAIFWLASDQASWVSGQTILLDGAAHTREFPRMLELFGV
jgi:3-oxoacyl-[acyl-carrier protein] reductase